MKKYNFSTDNTTDELFNFEIANYTLRQRVLKKFCRLFVPLSIVRTLACYKVLSRDYAHWKSIKTFSAIDKEDNPTPWYTYPAIEYLKQFDFSDKSIFEYGSGNSTLFWASRCEKITSVELWKEWYDTLKTKLPKKVDYKFFSQPKDFINAIENHADEFDIIVIDAKYRFFCAQKALEKLKKDGFIILDNSDWWNGRTSKLLRDAGLIQVDMAGFGPISDCTVTTSFFFTRKVQLKPISEYQPTRSIGSIDIRENSNFSF